MAKSISRTEYRAILDRLTKLSLTWSGTDKLFMICQYSAGLVALSLAKSPSLLQKPRIARLVASLQLVNGEFGKFRVVLRLFGLLPMLQWYDELSKRTNIASTYTHTLEKLQCISLLIYFPLEHISYFASRGIITSVKPRTIPTLARVSCAFWASYTVFKLLHVVEDLRVVKQDKASATEKTDAGALQTKERNLRESLIVNSAYFPMTLHWSLPNGFVPDEILIQLCGTIAAIWQLKPLWRSTA